MEAFFNFFWNSTGIAVPEAIDGYRTIGMMKLAELVETAAKLLGNPYPRDRDDRWDALLVASKKTSDELKADFERTDHLYQAFLEATRPLGFDAMDRQFWALAADEAGGYEEAATRYARSLG
jgi:Domain of unknown function (DUF4375)